MDIDVIWGPVDDPTLKGQVLMFFWGVVIK